MNDAHLHLVLTHIPVFGCVFGLCLFVMGMIVRNRDLQRTSLWMFAFTGACSLPTYLTGRPANAFLVKLMPGMSMDPSDQHAELAVIALTLALVLAVVALASLALSRKTKVIKAAGTAGILILAIATTAAMVWTASLGGQIRHSEVRPGTERASP